MKLKQGGLETYQIPETLREQTHRRPKTMRIILKLFLKIGLKIRIRICGWLV
jgi:hypothetical protein